MTHALVPLMPAMQTLGFIGGFARRIFQQSLQLAMG
jgi:hypothetical protein